VAAQPVERKLAAIFAADIAGYSRLMAHDEVGTLTRLKACRVIIDGLIATHRGRIFNTAGDSVIADFASAVDAVACAVAVQNTIATEDPGSVAGEPMRFRIGVHVGDVMVDGANLLGDGVNIAACLEGLAEPGAICVSAVVRDQVGNKLAVVFTDVGEQHVKNIPEAIRLPQVGSAARSKCGGARLCRAAAFSAARLPASRGYPSGYPGEPHQPPRRETRGCGTTLRLWVAVGEGGNPRISSATPEAGRVFPRVGRSSSESPRHHRQRVVWVAVAKGGKPKSPPLPVARRFSPNEAAARPIAGCRRDRVSFITSKNFGKSRAHDTPGRPAPRHHRTDRPDGDRSPAGHLYSARTHHGGRRRLGRLALYRILRRQLKQ